MAKTPYVLGIDLGSRSVGFARLKLHANQPCEILDLGSRCFEAGVDGNIDEGRDESRAAPRRQARLARRQIRRRAWRQRKVLRALQRLGLLPAADLDTPQAIHDYIMRIDVDLRKRHLADGDHVGQQTLLYRLRAKALDEALEPHDLGRALYHLAQRRGFESNRKTAPKQGEDDGAVKAGISELAQSMSGAGARTLGEYFSKLNPDEQRIRQRWTSRQMYKDEFEAIWASQLRYHSFLADDMKWPLHRAIFRQRPLKSQSGLIGKCDLVAGMRRAPMACMDAQRFRLLAAVNNLAMRVPGELDVPLSREQRLAIIGVLKREGDKTFAALRKLLGLPRTTKFNLEEGGEKKIPGNRSAAKLAPVFGDRWDSMTPYQKDEVIDDLLSIDAPEPSKAVFSLGIRKWRLTDEQAALLASVQLENDRARHCRKALRRLADRMEDGVHYATARKEEYPERLEPSDTIHDLLPPVHIAIPSLRNPAVHRALTELRKVVNTLIRKHGKPETIRIELARDLRNPRKKRAEIAKRNRANEREREAAKTRILTELPGFAIPSRDAVEKVLLAEECNWMCPFTGRGISMRSLLGANPQFDVEHIIPLSRCLENGYHNKTLCHHETNRHEKRNRTPFEAFAGDQQRWEAIIERVKRFRGELNRAKLTRFMATTITDDFVDRQLNDTRYASRLAADYLGLLYGGRVDGSRKLRVQVSGGGATAHLRNELGLNALLGDGPGKSRDDHRHHAVDAVAIAMIDPATVKRLADAAERAMEEGRRRFVKIAPPWGTFLEDVRTATDRVVVSHRVNHRVRGRLHEDTNYSKPHTDERGREVRHHRKPVTMLSAKEVLSIVDPIDRRAVQQKLAEVDGDVKKLENNWPTKPRKDGSLQPIKRVRYQKAVSVVSLGRKGHERHVAPGNNHHAVIVARKDAKGRVKWEDHPVTLLEAVQRKKRGEPIVKREWGRDGAFIMWFCPGDSLQMDDEAGNVQVFVVKSVSKNNYELRLHADGRMTSDIRKAGKAGGRISIKSADAFRLRNASKVIVSPIGEVVLAHD